MKITDFAISNRTAIVVLTIALSIGGLVSYVSLPKESQPQIEFATIVVTTIYPGASPDDVESIITQEIEREVATITYVGRLVNSRARNSHTRSSAPAQSIRPVRLNRKSA